MEKKTGKRLGKNIGLILRGFKIIGAFPKPVLLSRTISSIFTASVPFINIYFSAQILTELAGDRNRARLVTLVWLTIGLNGLFVLIKNALNRWKEYCNSMSWMCISEVFTEKLLSMDYIDIENPTIQQQVSQIQQHQNGMGFGLTRLLWHFDSIITGIIQIGLSVFMAFSLFTFKVPVGSAYAFLDSPLAVIAVLAALSGSVLVAPYLLMLGGKVFASASEENNKYNRIFTHYFFHMIGGSEHAKDIRIYDQHHLIDDDINKFILNNKWSEFFEMFGRYNALSKGIAQISNGLIYLFVAMKAFAGAFGVGGIVQYVGAVTQFGSGFAAVLTGCGELINNNPFLEKVYEFLDIPNKKYQGTLSIEKRDDIEYRIAFHDVSFKYPGSEAYALKHLNLEINIGCRMAVVGMNGSGKSTMIKLLCRLYDPTEGVITLNGIDIKKYNYDEYMGIFSVVFQDFKLLPFTLGQNVAAKMDYDENRVKATLKQTGFEARLAELPHGMESYLYKNFEESGTDISGGEAQKIAMARALYKNSPFIILDEPTAALDPKAEYEIYHKFNEIVGGKTAVYISHRLSSCRFCDDIAVFDEGELIQRGSHDTLVADENGKYYALWMAQAQYYAERDNAQNQ